MHSSKGLFYSQGQQASKICPHPGSAAEQPLLLLPQIILALITLVLPTSHVSCQMAEELAKSLAQS